MNQSDDGDYPHKKSLLFVFAHPDDESFGTGGTVAKAAAAGWHVELICATRGEEGQISAAAKSDVAAAGPIARPALGSVRERELRQAAGILGIAKIHFFPYRDGA